MSTRLHLRVDRRPGEPAVLSAWRSRRSEARAIVSDDTLERCARATDVVTHLQDTMIDDSTCVISLRRTGARALRALLETEVTEGGGLRAGTPGGQLLTHVLLDICVRERGDDDVVFIEVHESRAGFEPAAIPWQYLPEVLSPLLPPSAGKPPIVVVRLPTGEAGGRAPHRASTLNFQALPLAKDPEFTRHLGACVDSLARLAKVREGPPRARLRAVLREEPADLEFPSDTVNVVLVACHARVGTDGTIELQVGGSWVRAEDWTRELGWRERGPDVLVLLMCHSGRGGRDAVASVCRLGVPFVLAPAWAVHVENWCQLTTTLVQRLSRGDQLHVSLATARDDALKEGSSLDAHGAVVLAASNPSVVASSTALCSLPRRTPNPRRPCDAAAEEIYFRPESVGGLRWLIQQVYEPTSGPTIIAALATSGSGLTTLLAHNLRWRAEDGNLRFTALDPRSNLAHYPDASHDGLVLISPDLGELAIDDGLPSPRELGSDVAVVAEVAKLWLGVPPAGPAPRLLVVDWGDRPVEALREALDGVVVEDRWFRELEALDWRPSGHGDPTIPARVPHAGVNLKQALEGSHAPLAALDAALEARLRHAERRGQALEPMPALEEREIPRLIVQYAQSLPLTEGHFRVLASVAAQARNAVKTGAQDGRERGHASGARHPDNERNLAELQADLCSWRLLCRRPMEGPGPENYALIHPALAWSWNALNRRMTHYGRTLDEHWARRVQVAAPALRLRDARLSTDRARPLTEGRRITLSTNPKPGKSPDRLEVLEARALLSQLTAELCAHAFAGAHPSLYRLRLIERGDSLLLVADPDPDVLPARTYGPFDLAHAYLVARCAQTSGGRFHLHEARLGKGARGFLTPTGAVDVIGDQWDAPGLLGVTDAVTASAVLLDAIPRVVPADGRRASLAAPAVEVWVMLATPGSESGDEIAHLVDVAREFVPLLLRVGLAGKGATEGPKNLEPARRLGVEGAGHAIRVLLASPDGGWPGDPIPEVERWASCVCIAAEQRGFPFVVRIKRLEHHDVLRVADPQLADRRWLFVPAEAGDESSQVSLVDLARARAIDREVREHFARGAAIEVGDAIRPLAIRLGAGTLPWEDAPGAAMLEPAYVPALQAPLARTQRVGLGQSTVEPMWTASMLGVFLALGGWMEAPIYLSAVLPSVFIVATVFSYVLLRAFAAYVGIAYLAEHPEALRIEYRWAVLSARIPLRESARRIGRGPRGDSDTWSARGRALWKRRGEIAQATRDCAPELGLARFLWGVLLAGLAMARRDDPPVVFRPGLKFLGASMAVTGWLVYIGTTGLITTWAGLPPKQIAIATGTVAVLALFPALAFTMRIYAADVTVLDPRARDSRRPDRTPAAKAEAERRVQRVQGRETLFRGWYNLAVWLSLLVAGYSAYAVAFGGHGWPLGVIGSLVLALGLGAWILSRQPRAYMRGAAASLLARVENSAVPRHDAWREWADPPVADLTTQVLREATVRAALLGAANMVLDELNAPASPRGSSAPRLPPIDISVAERWRAAYFVADPWGVIHQVSGQGASEVPRNAATAAELYDDARVARLAGALLREVPDDTWIELPAFGQRNSAGNNRAFRLLVRKLALFDQSPLRGTLGIAVPIGEPCDASPDG